MHHPHPHTHSCQYQDPNPYNVYYDNYLNTNACTECTGLMFRVADDLMEWDSYREVFDFTPTPPVPWKIKDQSHRRI